MRKLLLALIVAFLCMGNASPKAVTLNTHGAFYQAGFKGHVMVVIDVHMIVRPENRTLIVALDGSDYSRSEWSLEEGEREHPLITKRYDLHPGDYTIQAWLVATDRTDTDVQTFKVIGD